MKILDRYLLREYLKPVFFCLTGFIMIYVVWDLLGHISKFINAGTPALVIAKFYIFMLAPALPMIVPASLLFATLYTLWTLTRSNEITAMRASGISLQRLMLPFIMVAVFFSLSLLALNETYVPSMAMWAQQFKSNKYKVVENAVAKNVHFINGRAHRKWDIGEIDYQSPSTLHKVRITQERKDGSKQTEISADRAEWLDGEWWLFNIVTERFNEEGNPIGKGATIAHSELGKPLTMLTESPEDIVSSNKPWEFCSAYEIWKHIKYQPNISRKSRAGSRYDFHNRLAMPWACLVVTLFAIPAGAKSGRQSIVNAILLVILVFLAFYAINLGGLYLGKQRILTEWLAAWLSNIVFLAVGIIMSFKMR